MTPIVVSEELGSGNQGVFYQVGAFPEPARLPNTGSIVE
jgi:hypothetical protein